MSITAEANREISEILQQNRPGEFLVKNVQDILSILRRHHLISSMRLAPALVGVHPQSRDGSGLNAQDVHELLDSIVQVGFVPARVQAIAVEITDDSERLFNDQLVRSAGTLLGCMDSKRLKVLSLSASHTNFALRLVGDGALHESDVVSVNGRLSQDLVSKRDPVLGDHCQHGLVWDVLSAEVATQWPQLLGMIQASFNATLQKTESEMQLLRRVWSLITRHGEGANVDYGVIKRLALASKPPCGQCLPGLFKFALRFLCLSRNCLFSIHMCACIFVCALARELTPCIVCLFC